MCSIVLYKDYAEKTNQPTKRNVPIATLPQDIYTQLGWMNLEVSELTISALQLLRQALG